MYIVENAYLQFIRNNHEFLTLTALEQHIGIPFQSLHKFIKTGDFPEKHLPLVQAKLEPLIHAQLVWQTTIVYARQMVREYQEQVRIVRENPGDSKKSLPANARQEQITDDLTRLYLLARNSGLPYVEKMEKVLTEGIPMLQGIVAMARESSGPLSLDDIRKLPLNGEINAQPC